MQPPILPWISYIKLVIWYFKLTVIHHTYQRQGHTAALEDSTNWAHYQPTWKIFKPPATRKCPNPHINQNSQACGGVRGQSRSWRTVPQWANSSIPTNYTSWTWFYPTANPNKNRQRRGQKQCNLYSQTKKFECNGHAVLLNEGQDFKKRFRLLETRKSKHGGLFHKTSPTTSQ